MLRHTINKMAYLLILPPMKTTVLNLFELEIYITIDNIFSNGDSRSYASLVPSIANLRAKEKGDTLAKQAIVFAKFANLERVFLGRPEAAKLCAILSLFHGNVCYM